MREYHIEVSEMECLGFKEWGWEHLENGERESREQGRTE